MTDDNNESHRGVKYQLPSVSKQFLLTYRTQMRLYTKSITLWVILALLLLIPILTLLNVTDLATTQGVTNPNSMFTLYLYLSPIIAAVIIPMVMGELLPSEFRDRSVYLNLSLPQSKASFYFGKFCAGMTVIIGMYVLAYGIVDVIVLMKYGGADVVLVCQSLAVALCGALACAATVYIISQFLQKKTVIICMAVWFIVLPGLAMIPYISNESFSDVFGYLPFFLTDYSMYVLEPLVTPLSLVGMFTPKPLLFPNITVSCLIGIIWVIVLLALGYKLFTRRQI